MGKNRRSKFQVIDTVHNMTVNVDSAEEVEFTKWLCRAVELKIISDFTYQPSSFKLADKIEYVNSKGKIKSLLRDHIYTPDFYIFLDPKSTPLLVDEFKVHYQYLSDKSKNCYVIDVKGGFQQDAGRSFSMNQKWMYEKWNIYVHKVIPKTFFKKFGILEEFKFTEKTHKPSKKYADYPTIEEVFLDSEDKKG